MDSKESTAFMERDRLDTLLEALRDAGYGCFGPQLRDGAIVYDSLDTPAELPQGWRDRQEPGAYQLERVESPRQFAWANGPQALKPRLFAPREELWQVQRDEQGKMVFESVTPQAESIAVIGVRACDLAALALQDAHFLEQAHPDPAYRARRENLFLVAVDCSHPAATCFCVSTGDGPQVRQGFDLRLQELEDGFLVTAGSTAGGELLEQLNLRSATAEELNTAEKQAVSAVHGQRRRLPGRDLSDTLLSRQAHPHWHEVAERCLSCGNCTAVCPTCFCYSEGEEGDLKGERSRHYRQWDSCFTQGHSYIHGIVIHAEIRHRYRQWLTHKLGTWHQQYGRSGCVGCGRCISWCPAGIDITEEAEAICRD